MVAFIACEGESAPTSTVTPPPAISTPTPAPVTPVPIPTPTPTAAPTLPPESIDREPGETLVELVVWGEDPVATGISFSAPNAIAVDSSNNVYVTEFRGNRVQKFTPDGVLITQWGVIGTANGEFQAPTGIAIDRDVYVSESGNHRVQKFSSDGEWLATMGSFGFEPGEFTSAMVVAVSPTGNLYVTDWGSERVQVLSPDGSFLAKYRGESGISPWGEDYLRNNKEESEARNQSDLDPQLDLHPQDYLRNESANIEKLFWGPISVKVDDQGAVYIVENCRHRIQVYDIKA